MTAGLAAERLRNAGHEMTTGIGKRNGAGPVMLRDYMDALPIAEATGLDYACKVTTCNLTASPPYRGTDRLILGIVLAVITSRLAVVAGILAAAGGCGPEAGSPREGSEETPQAS